MPFSAALALTVVLGTGPHYQQADEHRGEPPGLVHRAAIERESSVPRVTRRVYGYVPYWSNANPSAFRWDLLTDIIHFDAELAADGGVVDTHGWISDGGVRTPLIDLAHQRGVRVHLSATLRGADPDVLVSNPSARAAAIQNLVALVQQAQGDGLNLDVEFVSAPYASDFAQLVEEAAAALKAALPEAELTVAMPVYPQAYPGYDVGRIAAAADRLLMMEYDMHWTRSTTAGPVAALGGGAVWPLWVRKCVDPPSGYLAFAPANKLVLGVPYYGYDWPTASPTAVPASTVDAGTSRSYRQIANQVKDAGSWDWESETPWYGYVNASGAHQLWYEDAESLRRKYDYVNQKQLAGVMIWALGYDEGRTELWQALEDKFVPDAGGADAGAPPDAGTFDGGSPEDAGACLATEELCDGEDNDCDGALDEDGVCDPLDECPPGEPCPSPRPPRVIRSCGCGGGPGAALTLLAAFVIWAAVRRRS